MESGNRALCGDPRNFFLPPLPDCFPCASTSNRAAPPAGINEVLFLSSTHRLIREEGSQEMGDHGIPRRGEREAPQCPQPKGPKDPASESSDPSRRVLVIPVKTPAPAPAPAIGPDPARSQLHPYLSRSAAGHPVAWLVVSCKGQQLASAAVGSYAGHGSIHRFHGV
jgi:hypothetical protein